MLQDHSSTNSNVVHRNYDLDIFKLGDSILIDEKVSAKFNGNPSSFILTRIANKLKRVFVPLPIIFEKNRAFDPAIIQTKDERCISGGFQSPFYFEKVRQQILSEFTIKEEFLQHENHLKYEKLIQDSEQSVSIQVRRGDYVTNKLYSKLLGAQPLEYYHRALAHINEKFNNLKIFIFSDDIPWCRRSFTFDENVIFVENEKSKNGMASDLQLMSMCTHHIVSNSSYAWWGAWLDKSQTGITVAPKNWVNPEFKDNLDVNPVDIVPENWIRV